MKENVFFAKNEIGVDTLFHYQAAEISFKKFWNYDLEESSEVSVQSRIEFDAAINEAVDLFKSSSEETSFVMKGIVVSLIERRTYSLKSVKLWREVQRRKKGPAT